MTEEEKAMREGDCRLAVLQALNARQHGAHTAATLKSLYLRNHDFSLTEVRDALALLVGAGHVQVSQGELTPERLYQVTLKGTQTLARQVVSVLVALLSVLCVPACTLNPLVYEDGKGRKVASLGGSVLTRSTLEDASLTLPDGSVLGYFRAGKDEAAPIRAGVTRAALGTLAPVVGELGRAALSR